MGGFVLSHDTSFATLIFLETFIWTRWRAFNIFTEKIKDIENKLTDMYRATNVKICIVDLSTIENGGVRSKILIIQ